MTHHSRAYFSVLAIFLLTISLAIADVGDETFRIPKIEGISVDGSGEDWGNRGFRVEILTAPEGQTLSVEDFDVKFCLGWDSTGLYVLATVIDDIPSEHENLSQLWRKDCVEIIMAEDVGHSNKFMLAAASGADPKYSRVRSRLYDFRPEDLRSSQLSFEAASQWKMGSYSVELMLPWTNLGKEPQPGMRFAFQLVANDNDGADQQEDSLRVAWFPGIGPADSTKAYRVSLADVASDPVLLRIDRKIKMSQSTLTIQGASQLIRKQVVVKSGDKILLQKMLAEKNGRTHDAFRFEVSEGQTTWPLLSIEVSEKPAASFKELPTLGWVLDRYMRAVGGREAVERLTTRNCKGHYVNDDPQQDPLPLEAYAKTPDKWSLSLTKPKGAVKNGYDGKAGWSQSADRIERAAHLRRSITGWWLNPQGSIQLEEYFPDFTLKKKGTLDGHSVYVVESGAIGGGKHTLEFDTGTGFLARIDGRWKLEDYRSVDDIQLPFRIDFGNNRAYVLDEVKHNETVDDSLFVMPDVSEVFADAFAGIDAPKVLPMLKLQDLTYEHGEMNIPCRDGRFLYDLILDKGYQRALEIGTYNGYSTLWMGLALQKTGGRVITIEIDPVAGQEARENFQRAGLEKVIDSRINDAFDVIKKLEGSFDLIFIDANKEDYFSFLKILKDRVKPGGAILGHNVINYAPDMRDFLDAVQNDSELETTIHETSEEGFSVSIKRLPDSTMTQEQIPEPPVQASEEREPLPSSNDYIVMIASNINIRTGPSTDKLIIGRASKGEIFILVGETDEWYEIVMFSGDHRYIHKSLCAKLNQSELVPGHNMKVSSSEARRRSMYRRILKGIDRARQEADEVIPSSEDDQKNQVLRRIREDRILLDIFQSYEIQPALFRELVEEGSSQGWNQ